MPPVSSTRPTIIYKLRKEFDEWHATFMNSILYQHKQIYVTVNITLLTIEVELAWQCIEPYEYRTATVVMTADSSFRSQFIVLRYIYLKVLQEAASWGESQFEQILEVLPKMPDI